MSHCDKCLFCLSQWVTATNTFFICCQKNAKMCKNCKKEKKKMNKEIPKRQKKKCEKVSKVPENLIFFLALFGILLATYTHFVSHSSDSVQQTKICSSQWLSATDKTNLCCSDSIRQTILTKLYNIFMACYNGIGIKKHKNKHPFIFEFHQISSNCFGIPYAFYFVFP